MFIILVTFYISSWFYELFISFYPFELSVLISQVFFELSILVLFKLFLLSALLAFFLSILVIGFKEVAAKVCFLWLQISLRKLKRNRLSHLVFWLQANSRPQSGRQFYNIWSVSSLWSIGHVIGRVPDDVVMTRMLYTLNTMCSTRFSSPSSPVNHHQPQNRPCRACLATHVFQIYSLV